MQSWAVDPFRDRPTDDLARVEIQDGGQEHESGAYPDVSDIGCPRLIQTGDRVPLQQIGVDAEPVIGIGRVEETPPGDRLQPVPLHHAPKPFRVDDLALAFQFPIHPAVSVAGKFGLDPLDAIAQIGVLLRFQFGDRPSACSNTCYVPGPSFRTLSISIPVFPSDYGSIDVSIPLHPALQFFLMIDLHHQIPNLRLQAFILGISAPEKFLCVRFQSRHSNAFSAISVASDNKRSSSKRCTISSKSPA